MTEATKERKTISAEGISLIKGYEELKLKAYLCPSKVWTIGYGHTRTAREGMVITERDADALLLQDLRTAENAVNEFVTVPLTQNQFDALVSFVFNIGISAFKHSTLLVLLNKEDYQAAKEQFARWNKGSGGNVLQGLVRRRREEGKLFDAHNHTSDTPSERKKKNNGWTTYHARRKELEETKKDSSSSSGASVSLRPERSEPSSSSQTGMCSLDGKGCGL